MLRTPETQRVYNEEIIRDLQSDKSACVFCEREAIKNFGNYWKIIQNHFPYDNIAVRHDMLVPLRHFAKRTEMNTEEQMEVNTFLKNLDFGDMPDYNAIIENFNSGRSQKGHFHIHILYFK